MTVYRNLLASTLLATTLLALPIVSCAAVDPSPNGCVSCHVLDALGITDQSVRGFAIGTGAHGIGTARAFQESEEAGAFSGLAMGLCGLVTAVLFPLGVWLVRAMQ